MPETKPKLYFGSVKTEKRKSTSTKKTVPRPKKTKQVKKKNDLKGRNLKKNKILKLQNPKKRESIKPAEENTDNTLALQEFQSESQKKIEEQEVKGQKPFGSRQPQLKGNIKVKHNPAYSKERIPTGIPGLDGVIEGGLKKKSVTLAGGCAGAGKTIFGMQFILNGITQFNEPGVYVSFEENKHQIYEDMARFGWDMQKLERQGKFAFVQYTPEQVGKVLKTGGGIIRDVIDNIKAKRLVIDSISAFTLLHENELKKREASLALFDIIRKWGCTSIVVGQYAAAELPHESTAVEFEVDNIIWLYNIKKEDIRVRAIEVFKMRGTKHSAKIFPFEITDSGIVVYPEQSVF